MQLDTVEYDVYIPSSSCATHSTCPTGVAAESLGALLGDLDPAALDDAPEPDPVQLRLAWREDNDNPALHALLAEI